MQKTRTKKNRQNGGFFIKKMAGSEWVQQLDHWASTQPFAALLSSNNHPIGRITIYWTHNELKFTSLPHQSWFHFQLWGFSKQNVTLDTETCCVEGQQPAGQQISAATAEAAQSTGVELSASCRPLKTWLLKRQLEEEMFCFVLSLKWATEEDKRSGSKDKKVLW